MSLYFSASASLYILTLFAVIIFLLGFAGKLFLWKQGRAPSIHEKVLLKNIFWIFFRNVILQKQILQQSIVRWSMHMLIFVGFVGLLLQTSFLFFCSHFLTSESSLVVFFYDGKGKLILDFWGDWFGICMVVGLTIALCRRFVLKAEQLDTLYSDVFALFLLMLIAISGFWCEGVRIAQEGLTPEMRYSFIGYPIALTVKGLPLKESSYAWWVWVHVIASLSFIAYIPFSKMLHMFTSPTEILVNASEENLRKDIYG
jgi:nitrate reductase gamma subunit